MALLPVLPLRFGTVLPEVDAVIDELPAAHHDEVTRGSRRTRRRARFVLQGRPVDVTVLAAMLAAPGCCPAA